MANGLFMLLVVSWEMMAKTFSTLYLFSQHLERMDLLYLRLGLSSDYSMKPSIQPSVCVVIWQ